MSEKVLARVADMAMFKIIKKLQAQVDKLRVLDKLYKETDAKKKSEIEPEVIEQIERKVSRVLPKAEKRLEALKHAMYIMKDPTRWGSGDSG